MSDSVIVQNNIDLRKKQHISFSEYYLYRQCPFRWYLQYYLGIKEPANEFLVFGSAIHESIEEILKDSSKKDKIGDILREKIKENSNSTMANSFFGKNMAKDGVDILKKLNFYERFRGIDIAGIEDDLYLPLVEVNGIQIYFKGFIDFLGQYQKEDRYIVLDWKSAIKEWNLEKKIGTIPFSEINKKIKNNEELTREEYESLSAKYFFGQTALYQHFTSEKYEIDVNKIDVEYCTLIRQPADVKEYRINVTDEFREWALEDIKKVAKEIYTFKEGQFLNKVKIERKLKKYCGFCFYKKDICNDCEKQSLSKEEVKIIEENLQKNG